MTNASKEPASKAIWPLLSLNFFMADVHGGLGPFLGVFLQARQWSPAQIGIVMTIGGIAGMVVTTPAGALVDRTRHKRTIVVATAVIKIGRSRTGPARNMAVVASSLSRWRTSAA